MDSMSEEGGNTFRESHGGKISLIILILYTVVLAIGAAAEIFGIDRVLNLMIFKPPGR